MNCRPVISRNAIDLQTYKPIVIRLSKTTEAELQLILSRHKMPMWRKWFNLLRNLFGK